MLVSELHAQLLTVSDVPSGSTVLDEAFYMFALTISSCQVSRSGIRKYISNKCMFREKLGSRALFNAALATIKHAKPRLMNREHFFCLPSTNI